MELKLNSQKIENDLRRLGKSRAWLASKVGVKPQLVNYWINSKSLAGASKIAKALEYGSGKDLIVEI